MQFMVRSFAAFITAILASASAADVAWASRVTPVQKVVTMLMGMLEKGKKEKHDEQVQFAAYKQFCDDTTTNVQKQIKDADGQITMLNADIQKYTTSTNDLVREVQDLESDLATFSGDQKAATKVRELERVEYDKTHKDYTESIDAITKAIQILKQRATNVAQATPSLLQNVLTLERVPEKEKRAIEAFLARGSEEEALDLAQPPQAYGYEFQSHGVIDMLEKLKDKFVDERSALEKSELNQRHAYDLLMSDLKDSMSSAQSAITTKSQQRSKDMQLVATRQGDLQDTVSTKADDTKYLGDLTSGCTTKSSDFQDRQKLRSEEILAIEKAIAILSSDDVMGAAAKHLPSMMQVHSSKFSSLAQLRSNHENAVSNQMRMAAYLNDQATRIGSRVLSTIALRARDDPFSKVKKMIRDLITRLEEQAGEEAQHKGWCDTELADNEKVRKTRTAAVDSLRTEIDQLTASISKAAAEITKLTSEVADLDGAVAKVTALRQEDKAENEATIKDAQAAQTAVARAIIVLKEFYATAADATALVQKSGANPTAPAVFDQPYKGMAGESGGVIGMLEVIQSDFARLESDTTSDEVSQSKAHNKFMTESAVSKAQKQSDITHKSSKKQNEEQQLTDKKNDLISEEKELDAANKYFDKLKPSCLDAGMSFQEREARRQEEIQSLQEALRILNGQDIASMMQMD